MIKRISLSASRAVLLLGILAIACAFYFWSTVRPLPFDSTQWKSARSTHEYGICFRMSESLIVKLSEEKPSWEEMVTLLGKPDFQATAIIWQYKLRKPMCYVFPDDYHLSVIVEDGRVMRAFVNQG